ncbi:MAG TPA: substrate-binding domain-containing protein [Bacteroidota bacterium]|nr:substrate-binding domain-containing protein [Bacteroidota bacterium]
MNVFWLMILPSFLIAGCVKKQHKPEETPTKGELLVLVTDSHEQIMNQETEEYTRLYPDASVEVAGVSTREAIVHFLNDSVKCICVDRQLNQEEVEVAKKADLLFTENIIAEDALAVIVHAGNPIENISYQDVKEIVSGEKNMWKNIPGRGPSGSIEVVLTGRNSGMYELLQRYFFHLSHELFVTFLAKNQQEVMAYVSSHPQAFGIVSIGAVRNNPPSVKVLGIESTNIMKERFAKPSQINIYRSLYPMRYSLYLYTSTSSTGVAAGFSTFVRSMHGQKIIQNAGLVPVVIPNRVVQITTE